MLAETRRNFLIKGAALAASAAVGSVMPEQRSIAKAALPDFQPSWDSLANYQTPDWFRDAKFGMWAHWGPQCVMPPTAKSSTSARSS